MATSSSSIVATGATLSAQLSQLQQSASVVAKNLNSANRAFYLLLAELYMWWRDASVVAEYLDTQYVTTGRKFKRKVKHGINYAPLFWLAWGEDNGLTDDKTRRWSIVLNKLHSAYETEAQYHTGSVVKLANLIHHSGGVDGIVNEGKTTEIDVDDDDVSDDDSDGTAQFDPPMSISDRLSLLYGRANAFYSARPNSPTVDFQATLPSSDGGMSMVLVRKHGDQYQLIGASSDEEFIKPVAVQTYLNDFAALPKSTRVLFETLSTQCLPHNIQAFYGALVDTAKTKGTSGTKQKSTRRLLYLHANKEFVLSPMRAHSGVVTVGKMAHTIFEGIDQDVYLSNGSRRALERRQISGRNFNLYAPSNDSIIPRYTRPNLASHALRLQDHFEERRYLHLDFWPFYDRPHPPLPQLIVDKLPSGFAKWHATLSLAWFRRFANEFTTRWIKSHGQHIKRGHQKVMQLAFSPKAVFLNFVQRNERFEASMSVDFGKTVASGTSTVVHVQTKDFVVAMQAIADLDVNSDIAINVDADVIAMSYATTAADYKVYIPTCTEDGVRSGKYFKQYQPKPVPVVATYEDYNDQAEGDFDPE